MDNENRKYVLDIKNVSKRFGGSKALQDVSFQVQRGAVHTLCGENGAGKSTLMKILSGEIKKDSGQITFNGKNIEWDSPKEALKNGISIIAQELHPLLEMNIAENLFLGREPMKHGFLDKKALYRNAGEALKQFDFSIDVRAKMKDLSVAQMQIVEIAKAISYNSDILIMDEPTSAIGETEAETLFKIIKSLQKELKTILYISHRMKEIYQLSDYITVLRDGKHVITTPASQVSSDELVSHMIGKKISSSYFVTPRPLKEKEKLLTITGLSKHKKFKNINITLHKKEIVGIFGLMGSGRSSFLETIFGVKKKDEGTIKLHDELMSMKSPEHAIKNRIAYVTEDRKMSGLILAHTVRDNISLPSLKDTSPTGFIKKLEEKGKVADILSQFNIKVESQQQLAIHLSGGNQQKVVFGKWVLTAPDVLLLDEPTRGIDIGAKQEIYKFMNEYTSEGKGILMISSELPEILAMSHRIFLFKQGEIVGEYARSEFDQEKFMILAS